MKAANKTLNSHLNPEKYNQFCKFTKSRLPENFYTNLASDGKFFKVFCGIFLKYYTF